MKGKFAEEVLLFIAVLKWVVLATFIGGIVGVSTNVFLKVLNWMTGLRANFHYYYLFIPIIFVVSAMLITHLAPDAEGHGTEKVIEAVHTRAGKINILVVPIKLIASVITIAFGGSAGKEGPCAQIGAGLSSFFADIFKFDDIDRKRFVICGISAGFASVFGTPIAGAIFGVEVLFIGDLLYEALLPSFIAGMTSYHISYSLGIRYFYHPFNFMPVFSESFFLKIVLGGILFGLCSMLFIEIMRYGKSISERINIYKPLKGIIGGIPLVIFGFFVSRQYFGLGLDTIESCLSGKEVFILAFILKMIFTSITLNFGGSGGVVTPIFFIGATAGMAFAHIFNLDVATFSAIGFVSLLAGATNTPIAASIMATELFGAKIAPYAAVSCVISYLMTGHRSVYPSQILAITKSPSIKVDTGREIEEIKPVVSPREKSITGTILRGIKKVKKHI
ncbi:MAG: chloride channel protein [bacterium]